MKSGGDLVAYGGGAFFALRGNKCYELWRYFEPITACGSTLAVNRSGVQAALSAQRSEFRVSPNPLASGWAMLRYSLPKPGSVVVTVFDVAGRGIQHSVFSTPRSALSVSLDLRKLASGVYLVRLDADGYSATQKLVVQK
ncbi:MAG: T9SS type A sorting domain-containing protein [candidate division WOR-3 bacterium]